MLPSQYAHAGTHATGRIGMPSAVRSATGTATPDQVTHQRFAASLGTFHQGKGMGTREDLAYT